MQAISMIATLLFPAIVAVLLVDAYTFRDYARALHDLNGTGRS